MSTATLERKAKAEVAAPPEPIHPCRTQLAKLLAEHAAVVSSIEDFESRLTRSQLDLNEAISQDDDVEIARYQGMESVFGVKLSARRANLHKLAGTLPAAISAATNEFSTLLMAERDRRIAILAKRIGEALGTDGDRLVQGRYLDDLWDEAKPIQEIDMMRLNFNLIGASDETVLGSAKTLLACYDEILRAAKETI